MPTLEGLDLYTIYLILNQHFSIFIQETTKRMLNNNNEMACPVYLG